MTTEGQIEATLPAENPQEVVEVPTTKCSTCGWEIEIDCRRKGDHKGITLQGVLTCTRPECNTSWPIKLVDNVVVVVSESMPTHGSRDLSKAVKDGLREDVEEAERAHFSQCYKAAVVICRRAIQLGLEEKGAEGWTLGPVLEDALEKKLIGEQTFTLGSGIKDFGDGGAHRREDIHPGDAAMVIRVTTVVLNELFPGPPRSSEVSDVEELPW